MRPLLKHQKDVLERCWWWKSIALFLEMRLGKTKIVIERLRGVSNHENGILVIAPLTTLLSSWKSQLKDEGEMSVTALIGTREKRLKRFYKDRKWNLINYEGLSSLPEICQHPWDAVILDESAKLRNPQTKTSKLIVECFQRVPIKIILSGEPAPESPLDYFQQFKFLKGDFMGFQNFWSFRAAAFMKVGNWDWVPRANWKIKIKDYVQKNAIIMTKQDAGIQPRRNFETRLIAMEPKQKKVMKQVEKEFILPLLDPKKEEEFLQTKWKPVQWTWLSQIAGGFVQNKFKFKRKANELINLLEGELKQEKVVVWFRFNNEIRGVSKMLRKAGIKHVRLYGAMTPEERLKASDLFKFKALNDTRVILCQQKIGLYGLDLSAASTAIYYSNTYSLEGRKQSEQRIEHALKSEPLLIIDLVTEKSIDHKIVKALHRKHKMSSYYLKREIIDELRKKYNK